MQRQQEISNRNEYIKTLNQFVFSCKNVLDETLLKLNWTENATVLKSEVKPLVTCPLNVTHQIATDRVDDHVKMCRWHQQGYRDDHVPLPSPPKSLPASSVVIDKDLQRDIILKAARDDSSIKIAQLIRQLAVS